MDFRMEKISCCARYESGCMTLRTQKTRIRISPSARLLSDNGMGYVSSAQLI
jgi:hypothetical protein